MDLQTWTWVLVGITFTLYIGIAIWSRAVLLKNFMLLEEEFHHLQTDWQQPQTGCLLHHLYQWLELFHLMGMTGLFI